MNLAAILDQFAWVKDQTGYTGIHREDARWSARVMMHTTQWRVGVFFNDVQCIRMTIDGDVINLIPMTIKIHDLAQ